MSINWKVRVKSKTFWLAIIPAALLLVQVLLAPFGFTFDVEPLNTQLLAIVNAVFVVLVILGIVTDPTTKGVSDSSLVQTYSEPRTDDKTKVLEQYLQENKAA